MSTAAVAEIPEPITKRADATKIARLVALKHLTHEGVMLEKILRQNRQVERMAKFAATNDPKDLEASDEEEEVAVNIGNEQHYHYQGTPPTEPPAAPTNQSPSTVEKNTTTTTTTKTSNGLLPTLLVGAAMLAGGSGLGYIVNDLLKPTPASMADTDTDSVTEIDVKD